MTPEPLKTERKSRCLCYDAAQTDAVASVSVSKTTVYGYSCKRPSFVLQKLTFRRVKANLSQGKR